MNSNNGNTLRPEAQDDIIELGAASVETKGGGIVDLEIFGEMPSSGISDE